MPAPSALLICLQYAPDSHALYYVHGCIRLLQGITWQGHVPVCPNMLSGVVGSTAWGLHFSGACTCCMHCWTAVRTQLVLLQQDQCACQVGGINSVGALHDARNKQVPLNPLRARKGSVGQAANPVIRQHSMAQQAQAKQARHFTGAASTLLPACLSPHFASRSVVV